MGRKIKDEDMYLEFMNFFMPPKKRHGREDLPENLSADDIDYFIRMYIESYRAKKKEKLH